MSAELQEITQQSHAALFVGTCVTGSYGSRHVQVGAGTVAVSGWRGPLSPHCLHNCAKLVHSCCLQPLPRLFLPDFASYCNCTSAKREHGCRGGCTTVTRSASPRSAQLLLPVCLSPLPAFPSHILQPDLPGERMAIRALRRLLLSLPLPALHNCCSQSGPSLVLPASSTYSSRTCQERMCLSVYRAACTIVPRAASSRSAQFGLSVCPSPPPA